MLLKRQLKNQLAIAAYSIQFIYMGTIVLQQFVLTANNYE